MSRWAFLFLMYYVCILFTQPQNRFYFLYPYRIAQLSILLALACHFFACMQEQRPLIRMGPTTFIAVLLLAFGMISQYAGPLMTNTAWNAAVDNLVKSCIVMIMIEAMAYTIYRVWAVQATILLATLWWVKAGLRLGSAGATYGGDRIMGPAVSIVENPNGFAYLFCIVLPIYLYFYQQYPNKYLKGFFLFLALAAVYSILNTGSRTGVVVLIAMSLFLVPKYFFKHKVALIVVSAGIFIIMGSVGALNIERFKTIPTSIKSFLSGEEPDMRTARQDMDVHSATERRLKNRDTWRLIKQYPLLGVGMNPDQSEFAADFPYATGDVHNELLMAGKQMGIIGMALYLSMIMVLFFGGRSVQLRTRGWWPAMSDLGWTFKLQAVGFLVGGMFSPVPWNAVLFILAGSASALLLNMREMPLEQFEQGAVTADNVSLVNVEPAPA